MISSSKMQYRREIDGLRAFAVVPVILFHGGMPGFEGGFIGVDIFFVISGYLITTILLGDLERNEFSIKRFYERRARRILPALVFVILCTAPFAWSWMLPSQLKDFGLSLGAVALFISNILFWRQSGYFDAATELKPMLHTWSLSVEEQYYIIFPLLLWVIWRVNKKLVAPALIFAIACSLALAEWGWRAAPVANFYLSPTRFWEILVGSLCAHWLWAGHARSAPPFAATVGLGMIIGSIFVFSSATPTPSVWTILPVLGTALIILFCSPGTLVSRILSFRPFVWIGLISYSAYLWHQPLLALARIRLTSELSLGVSGGLIVATFILGWLTWRFVERPFRIPAGAPTPPKAKQATSERRVLALSCGALLALIAMGTCIWQLDGAPSRRAPSGVTFDAASRIEHMLRPNRGLDDACDAGGFGLSPACRTGDNPSVVLWGDSFAMHLAPAFYASAGETAFVQHTLSACGPFINAFVNRPVTPWHRCRAFNQAVLQWILEQESVETVILSSAFQDFQHPVYDQNGVEILEPERVETALMDSILLVTSRLRESGKKVVFVSPPPVNGNDLGRCFLRQYLNNPSQSSCGFSLTEVSENYRISREFLYRISFSVPVVFLEHLMCPSGACYTSFGETSVYRDTGHLSVPGSAMLGVKFKLFGRVLATAR